ncbi:MAG: element excision factor XisI family protein [Pyrinomonadaceae bacterium]
MSSTTTAPTANAATTAMSGKINSLISFIPLLFFADVLHLPFCSRYQTFHLRLRDGKVWVEWDGAEPSITQELLDAGIPKTGHRAGLLSPRKTHANRVRCSLNLKQFDESRLLKVPVGGKGFGQAALLH